MALIPLIGSAPNLPQRLVKAEMSLGSPPGCIGADWHSSRPPVDREAMTSTLTSPAEQQANIRLNFNNRDFEFSELPRNAQLLLQDLMRLDQQIGQLQFELRHLQAARHVYDSNLRQVMNEEDLAGSDQPGQDGAEHHEN